MLYLITLHWGACIQTLTAHGVSFPLVWSKGQLQGDRHCEKRCVKKVEELNKSLSPFYFLLELLECSWDVGLAVGVYPWVLALPFLRHRLFPETSSRKLLSVSPYSQKSSFMSFHIPNSKTDRWLNLNNFITNYQKDFTLLPRYLNKMKRWSNHTRTAGFRVKMESGWSSGASVCWPIRTSVLSLIELSLFWSSCLLLHFRAPLRCQNSEGGSGFPGHSCKLLSHYCNEKQLPVSLEGRFIG